jgi:hypothetical protein
MASHCLGGGPRLANMRASRRGRCLSTRGATSHGVGRCTPAHRQAPNPALKLIGLDNRVFAGLSGGQRAVAESFENPRPRDGRSRGCFVGSEAKPRDGPACCICSNRIHWHTIAFDGIESSRTQVVYDLLAKALRWTRIENLKRTHHQLWHARVGECFAPARYRSRSRTPCWRLPRPGRPSRTRLRPRALRRTAPA